MHKNKLIKDFKLSVFDLIEKKIQMALSEHNTEKHRKKPIDLDIELFEKDFEDSLNDLFENIYFKTEETAEIVSELTIDSTVRDFLETINRDRVKLSKRIKKLLIENADCCLKDILIESRLRTHNRVGDTTIFRFDRVLKKYGFKLFMDCQ